MQNIYKNFKMVSFLKNCRVDCNRNNNNNNNNDSDSDSDKMKHKNISHFYGEVNNSCEKIKSNKNNNKNNKKNNTNIGNLYKKQQNLFNIVTIITIIWVILTLASGAVNTQAAAVYSNVGLLTNPNFEPICSTQQEHFIESDGKESSVILEFNPGYLGTIKKSCTRILSAPPNYGFIIRLILPKIRRGHRDISDKKSKVILTNAPTTQTTSSNDMSTIIEQLNTTTKTFLKANLGRSCPLSIFSSLDPHTPQWRVDPCQIEDTAPEMEDPVRLFHGRVRIIWEHNQHKLNSKLMITALGKGNQCRNENKHQCLKIGDEPILCVSKALVCDGIRHCPYSNEYDSDEDYNMCWKRRHYDEPIPPAMESDIFEHFALEVFRNLFAFDAPMTPDAPSSTTKTQAAAAGAVNSTTLRKVDKTVNEGIGTDNTENSILVNATELAIENATDTSNGHHRRNSTRFGVNSDLSKYGPWGYLMLGMLLCGGALLICGLWASATQHAVNNEREAALQGNAAGIGIDHHQSGLSGPPNYEELDPPPAYSVLFPNNKAASNTTLSSLASVTPASSTAATTAIAVIPVLSTANPDSTNETIRASSSQHSQLAN